MQRKVFSQRFFSAPDVLILLLVASCIYGMVEVGNEWRAEFNPTTHIDLSLRSLPYYTLLSAARGMVAYFLSLAFTLVVGYTAAKSRKAEQIIIPMLDILQSVPVLVFLPGLVLSLISIFPNTKIGLELAAVLMIFTGQVWNMTFSFYSSLKSVPTELHEAATVIGLNWKERLSLLELPFSAVGLAWNSLLSMAGGWFFLGVCEAFQLGDQEFRLPGLGAYMAVAVERGDRRAMVFGVFSMIFLIVAMDFLIWRPILAWVQRFRLEEVPGAAPTEPLMRIVLRESRILRWVKVNFRRYEFHHRMEIPVEAKLRAKEAEIRSATNAVVEEIKARAPRILVKIAEESSPSRFRKLLEPAVFIAVCGVIFWGAWKLLEILLEVPVQTWALLLRNTLWTFVRVFLALVLSTLWAVPAGIWIGISPRRVRIAQPIVQILASFPAPMLYPIAIAFFLMLHFNFQIGSMLLMMLGVQWYILFNVLAGALRIPRELIYALDLMQVPRSERWRRLYLPSVFPALVTGWVTAAGGAWNTSIVAEFARYGGKAFKATGIGATITEAAEGKDLRMLAASASLVVVFVVILNRAFWQRLYFLAQNRFRMDA